MDTNGTATASTAKALPDTEEIRAQLERIISSPEFRAGREPRHSFDMSSRRQSRAEPAVSRVTQTSISDPDRADARYRSVGQLRRWIDGRDRPASEACRSEHMADLTTASIFG